jgi:hypothetical protein
VRVERARRHGRAPAPVVLEDRARRRGGHRPWVRMSLSASSGWRSSQA